jgi:hypothetical protein
MFTVANLRARHVGVCRPGTTRRHQKRPRFVVWHREIVVLLGGKRGPSGAVMQDYLAHLEKLRADAAECALIRDLATDPAKRELFDRLSVHLKTLADQVEMAMLAKRKA